MHTWRIRAALSFTALLGSFIAIPKVAVASEESVAASPEEAALMVACGLAQKPGGRPVSKDGTGWTYNPDSYAFKIRDARKSYRNAVCELFVLKKISEVSDRKVDFTNRCQSVANDLYSDNVRLQANGGSGGGYGGALESFLGASGGGDNCSDPVTDDEKFGCGYESFKDRLEEPGEQRAAIRDVYAWCKSKGANMTATFDSREYNSLMNAGVDVYGGGACGVRGGAVVVQQQNKWYDTVGNVVLGLAKVGLPIWAMSDANRRQQHNAHDACEGNQKLGFPCIVTAGQASGSCSGGCGYYNGGYGGNFYNGGAYTGFAGGCPTGACYGNGGYVVGGTGVGFAGGAYGGGGCSIPPYALSYAGCGAGGYGAGAGAGYGGYYGPGGGYGSAYGLPGPYGTAGGGTGWGGPGAPGGYQGQPSYWGNQPFNSQAVDAQARMYQAYASMLARQAQQTSAAAKVYEGTLKDLQKVQDKSYEAYIAYQMAQSGYGSYASAGGVGGATAYGTSNYYGLPNSGYYYPPYTSSPALIQGTTGTRLNLGVSASFSGVRTSSADSLPGNPTSNDKVAGVEQQE